MTRAEPLRSTTAARPPLLELRGVRASYGIVEVVHGVDLAVPAGSVVAVLGPNGAGKTTLLKVAAGLLRPSAGDVFLAGCRVTGANPVDLARVGLCLIPEGRGVFPTLTVRENLRMVTYRGVDRAAVEEKAFTRFPRLAERRDQPAGSMSGGEQQMLAVARAISSDPAVLLLDELSMGLAPRIVDELYATVAALAADGVTVLVVEQFAAAVLEVADITAVMIDGRIALAGHPSVIEAGLENLYLGGRTAPQPAATPEVSV